MPEWYVSYAWGDETPEGAEREAVVDRLCAEAEASGRRILRDKAVLGLGASISDFMRRIGAGDRVFVVLSDKYLRSPFCMFELNEVWKKSGQDEQAFLGRVRVYTLGDARIWTQEGRAGYAEHWRERYEGLRPRVADLGDRDLLAWRQMRAFHHNVGDMLAALANIVQPRSFDELVRYGFADTPP